MKLSIQLSGMSFYAYHGVLEQEQKVGNTFVVDLTLYLNSYESIKTDELETTINYAEVYEVIQREMNTPSLLLERVVGRIAEALMREFALIESLSISLSKCKAPFHADMRAATVSLELKRGEL